MDRFVIRNSKNSEDSNNSKRIKLEPQVLCESPSPKKLSSEGEICSYGKKCYRRNVHHFREYKHPHLDKILELFESSGDLPVVENMSKELLLEQIQAVKKFGDRFKNPNGVVKDIGESSVSGKNEPNTSATKEDNTKQEVTDEGTESQKKDCSSGKNLNPYEKWKLSEPFNIFLTSIGPERTYFSISFVDLFHPSFGNVKSVCHINFMIEESWLMDQVVESSMWGKPTTIIYGTENPGIDKLSSQHDWIMVARAKSPHAFGHHHTKMSFIEYDDGSVRFVVYTANLIESDWLNKTQGLWISPKCFPVTSEEKNVGESPTGFRNDMLSYLVTYQMKILESWMNLIRKADCSQIKVFFVASAPNLSQSLSNNGFNWGIKKVERILRQHQTAAVTSQWPIIAQCSSIGSLGKDNSWLQGEWGSFMEGPSKCRPPIKLVYPSVSDVKQSAEGEEGADCLPYGNATHSKQRWLEQHMCRWIGFTYNRTYALPHIKTYCRISPDCQEMAWFILTSANLSKAAWGKLNNRRDQLLVMSWECGVMFLPKFLTGESSFKGSEKPIDNGSRASSRIAADRNNLIYEFPVPFDIPVTQYTGANKPWLVDYLAHSRRHR